MAERRKKGCRPLDVSFASGLEKAGDASGHVFWNFVGVRVKIKYVHTLAYEV